MKNVALLAISLLLLIYAGSGNCYQVHHSTSTSTDISGDIPDENDTDAPAISSNIFYSIVQILQPVFHADLALEFDLPVVAETKAHSTIKTSLNFTSFYRTLFRAIISPNAP
jgi:hypothetical protein